MRCDDYAVEGCRNFHCNGRTWVDMPHDTNGPHVMHTSKTRGLAILRCGNAVAKSVWNDRFCIVNITDDGTDVVFP